MALFDGPLRVLSSFIETQTGRSFPIDKTVGLSEEETIVLRSDTGLSLGEVASCALVLWDVDQRANDPIRLIGPDFDEADGSSFGQVVVARASFADDYEGFGALRDAVYGMHLPGLLTRHLPRQQRIIHRVSKEALSAGFSARTLGSGLIRAVEAVAGVEAASVLFVTSSSAISLLQPAADEALQIGLAMSKMHEEMVLDCDSCELADVCETVAELKRMRDKLIKEGRPTRRKK